MDVLIFKKGTPPMEIVESIRQMAFDPEQFGSTDSYISWLVDNLSRCHEIEVRVTGNTTEDRAASLVEELKRHGLISFE